MPMYGNTFRPISYGTSQLPEPEFSGSLAKQKERLESATKTALEALKKGQPAVASRWMRQARSALDAFDRLESTPEQKRWMHALYNSTNSYIARQASAAISQGAAPVVPTGPVLPIEEQVLPAEPALPTQSGFTINGQPATPAQIAKIKRAAKTAALVGIGVPVLGLVAIGWWLGRRG